MGLQISLRCSSILILYVGPGQDAASALPGHYGNVNSVPMHAFGHGMTVGHVPNKRPKAFRS
jgi:hypothetical protein